MIKIQEKKKQTTKKDPYYILKVEYMIGDADGDTFEEEVFSIQSGPVLEKFCKILDKLNPLKGTWGIVLDRGIERWFEEGQITQEDVDFWNIFVYSDYNEEDLDDETNKMLDLVGDELGYLVRGETEYSFLVYQDYSLKYVNEYGEKFNTYFED